MITLHRLGHAVEQFQLNPNLIMTVEATPDTVITLTTGQKVVVAEPPEKVAADVERYRAEVLARALLRRHELRIQQQSPGAIPLRPASPALLKAAAESA